MLHLIDATRPARAPDRRLGPPTRALVALLVFLAVGALGGGTTMVLAPDGALIGMDPAWLESVPLIDDWLVPGLWLIGLGGCAALTAWAVAHGTTFRWAEGLERATQQEAAWSFTQAIGAALVLFIGYEATVVTAPEGRWMQVVMGAVGLGLLLLPRVPRVRADLRR